MEDPSEWSQRCPCGKRFFQPNGYTTHINSCQAYKKGVSSSLEAAKSRWAAKNVKPKKGKEAIESWYGKDELDLDIEISRPPTVPNDTLQDMPGLEPEAELAPLGRGFRVIKPVERYDDNFIATSTTLFERVPDTPTRSPTPEADPLHLRGTAFTPAEKRRQSINDFRKWKRTEPNSFYLSKLYWTLEDRPHDPDSFTSHTDLVDDGPEDSAVDTSAGRSDDANDSSDDATNAGPTKKGKRPENPYRPFPNYSSYVIGQWFWSERDKSREAFEELLTILTSEGFNCQDLLLANWTNIHASLTSSQYVSTQWNEERQDMWVDDGASWQTASVTIEVPFNSTSFQPGPRPFTIEGFRYRPLVPLIRSKLQESRHSDHFHSVPYDLRWQPPGAPDCRVYGELYHSPSFLDAYREIQALPPEEKQDHLPRYVVALMFASDETMLTSFGSTKLWPLYISFGNDSKYRRAKTGLGLMEEVAYFQHIPDQFDNWYISHSHKKRVGRPLATHVNRELFQAQWKVLLDDDFLHAYLHGIAIDCHDGIRRRFYPRIFTYAADYPERTMVVSIRNMGECPCPRCLAPLDRVHELGLPSDRDYRTNQRRVDNAERRLTVENARKLIYAGKYHSVNSKAVEKHLKSTSLVPTRNAFSERLSAVGLDVHNLVAVDILHEVEIGVWKSLLIHLLRLLEVVDMALINSFNHRYRQIPTFGKGVIRRFSKNLSELKQLAARDYEDALQCAIPVFDGLFSGDHGVCVQGLLFSMAHWHALAKLRMHTEYSLDLLDEWTKILGEDARAFVELTCSEFPTKELKREYEARAITQAQRDPPPKEPNTTIPQGRKRKQAGTVDTDAAATASPSGRIAEQLSLGTPTESDDKLGVQPRKRRKAVVKGGAPAGTTSPTDGSRERSQTPRIGDEEAGGRRDRTWNINTPKFHSLGDVASYIRRFGTTDSYSTQLSERFHRFSKFRYRKTNKKNVSLQLSRLQTRQTRLRKLRKQFEVPPEEQPEPFDLGSTEPGRRWYFIGKSQNKPVHLGHFIRTNEGDLAVRGFLLKLKRHLFVRIIAALLQEAKTKPEERAASIAALESLSSSFTAEDLANIHFHSERIYRHAIFKVRYTTYDCHYNHDTFNPSTSRRDFMCLRADADVNGQNPDAATNSKPFLFVRLLGIFHTNVIYTGPGALDFRKRRLDFLWVRWFQQPSGTNAWMEKRLDILTLAPVASSASCDFLDPADVLRAAHVVPRFASGPLYDEESQQRRVFSKCAHDRLDWKEYLLNRFADRDMTMRFHPGITPGHLHAYHIPVDHEAQSRSRSVPMDCDAPPNSRETDDVSMGEGITDSEDSNYDPSSESDNFSGNENADSSSEGQEPDSGSENSDVYH